jgi:hypothetical protein
MSFNVQRHLVCEIHVAIKWVIYFSAALFVTRIHTALLSILRTRGAQQGSVPMVTGTAAREYALRQSGRRQPDANVFRRLEQRLRETGSGTPTAHMRENLSAECSDVSQ